MFKEMHYAKPSQMFYILGIKCTLLL